MPITVIRRERKTAGAPDSSACRFACRWDAEGAALEGGRHGSMLKRTHESTGIRQSRVPVVVGTMLALPPHPRLQLRPVSVRSAEIDGYRPESSQRMPRVSFAPGRLMPNADLDKR
jgi:hypothetical protein